MKRVLCVSLACFIRPTYLSVVRVKDAMEAVNWAAVRGQDGVIICLPEFTTTSLRLLDINHDDCFGMEVVFGNEDAIAAQVLCWIFVRRVDGVVVDFATLSARLVSSWNQGTTLDDLVDQYSLSTMIEELHVCGCHSKTIHGSRIHGA